VPPPLLLRQRVLRGRRSERDDGERCITLAVPDLSGEYLGQLADAVVREAGEHGWQVLVRQTCGLRDVELRLLQRAGQGGSEGLIIQPLAIRPEDEGALAVPGPVVLIGERPLEGPVDHVTLANAAAAQTAVQHLLSTGRRRVAVIGVNSTDTQVTAGVLRDRGYRAALEAAGVPLDPSLVADVRGWDARSGARAAEDLLRTGAPFDAVFAFTDDLAIGALSVLAQHGLRVPQDVAVVGFDNTRASACAHPPLTTVDPGSRAVAHSAVSLLDERIRRGTPGASRRSTAVHQLVVREST